MNKLAVVLAGAVLLTAGCSSTTDPAFTANYTPAVGTEAAPTSPEPVVEPSGPTDEEVSDLTVVTLGHKVFPLDPDDDIVSLAHAICAAYDRGDSTKSIASNMVKGAKTITVMEAAYFIGVSTAAYCPEYNAN